MSGRKTARRSSLSRSGQLIRSSSQLLQLLDSSDAESDLTDLSSISAAVGPDSAQLTLSTSCDPSNTDDIYMDNGLTSTPHSLSMCADSGFGTSTTFTSTPTSVRQPLARQRVIQEQQSMQSRIKVLEDLVQKYEGIISELKDGQASIKESLDSIQGDVTNTRDKVSELANENCPLAHGKQKGRLSKVLSVCYVT